MAGLEDVHDVQSLSYVNNQGPCRSANYNDTQSIEGSENDSRGFDRPTLTDEHSENPTGSMEGSADDSMGQHSSAATNEAIRNLTVEEQEEMRSLRSTNFIPEDDIPSIDRRLSGTLERRGSCWTSDPPGVNTNFPTFTPNEPIKVILVGVGGVGKSTLGNVLADKTVFTASDRGRPETKDVCGVNFSFMGQDLTVFDTPGYVMTEIMENTVANAEGRLKLGKAHKAIQKGLKKIGDGIHVIAFVMSAGNDRHYEADVKIMKKAKILNSQTFKHCMVVVTHADPTYTEAGREQLLRNIKQNTDVIDLLDEIKDRVVLIEMGSRNRLSEHTVFNHTYKCEHNQVRELVLAMVAKVVTDNSMAGHDLVYPTEYMLNDLERARQRIAKQTPHGAGTDHPGLHKLSEKNTPRCSYHVGVGLEIQGNEECFPTKAKVYTTQGEKVMKELCLNDQVLQVDYTGGLTYGPVILFSHASADAQSSFVSIKTESGKILRLSAGHLLHINELDNLKAARNVNVNDAVFVISNDKSTNAVAEKVVAVGSEMLRGLYCPHTPSGTIVVDGVVASCYTDIVPTMVAHGLLLPVRVLHRVLPTEWYNWLHAHSHRQSILSTLRAVVKVWQ